LRFWDTSAIVPLLVKENSMVAMQSFYRDDSALFVWWGTEIECIFAIARVEREGMVSTSTVAKVTNRLKLLSETWHEIQPVEEVRKIGHSGMVPYAVIYRRYLWELYLHFCMLLAGLFQQDVWP